MSRILTDQQKEARREYHKAYYRRNREKRLAWNAAYRKRNRPRITENHRRWRSTSSKYTSYAKKYHYLKTYGLEDFDALVRQQGGQCGICGTTVPGGRGVFEVDHNHKTKTVRGVLCHQCNGGGGKFHDDPILLAKAAEWFTK